MDELKEQNERLKKSLTFVDEQLEYTYDILEKYSDPWLTICTGSCFDAFMTDYQRKCEFCLKKYCERCWDGDECEGCKLEHCDKCISEYSGCPDCNKKF